MPRLRRLTLVGLAALASVAGRPGDAAADNPDLWSPSLGPTIAGRFDGGAGELEVGGEFALWPILDHHLQLGLAAGLTSRRAYGQVQLAWANDDEFKLIPGLSVGAFRRWSSGRAGVETSVWVWTITCLTPFVSVEYAPRDVSVFSIGVMIKVPLLLFAFLDLH